MADKPPSRKELPPSHSFHELGPRHVFPHDSSSLRSSESSLSPIFNHHSMPASPASSSFWNAVSAGAPGQEFDDRFEDQLFPGVSSASEFSRYRQMPSQSSLFFTDQVAADSPTSRIPETHRTQKQSILTPISGLAEIDVGFESAFPPSRKWSREIRKKEPGLDKQEKPRDFGCSPAHEVRNVTSVGAQSGASVVEAPNTPNSSLSSSSSEHHEDYSSQGGAAALSAETTGDKPAEEKVLLEEADHKPSVEAAKKPAKPRKKGQKRIREPRIALVTKSDVEHLEDGYRWRKYGQKAVKNSPHPRSYYRCTHAKCSVKKRVERCCEDPSLVVTTYEGQHTHHSPAVLRRSAEAMPQISFGNIPTSQLATCLLTQLPPNPFSGLHPSLSMPYSFSGHTNFDVNRNLQGAAASFRPPQLMPECEAHRLHNAIVNVRPGAGTVAGAAIQPPVDEGLLDDMFPSAVRKPQ